MKINAILALATLAAAVVTTPALATVVTFDTQPEVYFIPSVTDGGYKFDSIADGFGTNNSPLWPSNGTMHLMSWTNTGSTSGFVMTALDGSAFTLNAFDFGGGYVDGFGGVSTLIVSGTGGPMAFSKTFTSGVDFINYQYSTLFMEGLSATQLTFTALGDFNRASFDNLVVNSKAVVPEPAAWAMMILGMGAVGAALRRKNAATAAVPVV